MESSSWIRISHDRYYNKITGVARTVNSSAALESISKTPASSWTLTELLVKKKRARQQHDQAVSVLQSSFRCSLAHRKTDWRRQKSTVQNELQQQRDLTQCAHNAATTIQRTERGRCARKQIDQKLHQELAATTIQRIGRGHNQRNRMRLFLMSSSILAIQCAIRVWRARSTVEWKNQQQEWIRCRRDAQALEEQKKNQQAEQQHHVHHLTTGSPPPHSPAPPPPPPHSPLLNRVDKLKISIGMVDDEIKMLQPIMDAAALAIQRQYHRLQAKRRFEWKTNVKRYKLFDQNEKKKVEHAHALSVLQEEANVEEEQQKIRHQAGNDHEQSIEPTATAPDVANDPLEMYNRRQNSVQLHAHCAAMLIQATYRCYRTRIHLTWIQETMNVVFTRRIPFLDRPLLLPHTVMAQAAQDNNESTVDSTTTRVRYTRQHHTSATAIQTAIRIHLSRQKVEWKQRQLQVRQERRQNNTPCTAPQIMQREQNRLRQLERYTYTESPVEDVFYSLSGHATQLYEKDVLRSLMSPRLVDFVHPLVTLMESLLPSLDNLNGDAAGGGSATNPQQQQGQQRQRQQRQRRQSGAGGDFLKQLLQPGQYKQTFQAMLKSTSSGQNSITLRDFEHMCWYGFSMEDITVSKEKTQQVDRLCRERRTAMKLLELLPINSSGVDTRGEVAQPLPVEAVHLAKTVEHKKDVVAKNLVPRQNIAMQEAAKDTTSCCNASSGVFPRARAPLEWLDLDSRALFSPHASVAPPVETTSTRFELAQQTSMWVTENMEGEALLDNNDAMEEEEEQPLAVDADDAINGNHNQTIDSLPSKTHNKTRSYNNNNNNNSGSRQQRPQTKPLFTRAPMAGKQRRPKQRATTPSTTLRALMSGPNLSLFQGTRICYRCVSQKYIVTNFFSLFFFVQLILC